MKIFIFRMRDRSKKIGYKRRRYFEITDRSKKIRLFWQWVRFFIQRAFHYSHCLFHRRKVIPGLMFSTSVPRSKQTK